MKNYSSRFVMLDELITTLTC